MCVCVQCTWRLSLLADSWGRESLIFQRTLLKGEPHVHVGAVDRSWFWGSNKLLLVLSLKIFLEPSAIWPVFTYSHVHCYVIVTPPYYPTHLRSRSPSPEPIYSHDGKRLNTRDVRSRKKLEEERHELVQRATNLNPEYRPPVDYKYVNAVRKFTCSKI